MIVIYNSNDSGGRWWLTAKHWEALEEAGWNVHWGNPKSSYGDPLKPCPRGETWLGAEARSVAKEFGTIEEAKDEFGQVTGLIPDARGCSYCGPPHEFYEHHA